SVSTAHAEEMACPLHQEIDEQDQQRHPHHPADPDESSVEVADLLLPGDRALLQLQRALGHPPILGQLLTLGVADLSQQLPDLVATFHPSLLVDPGRVSELHSSPQLRTCAGATRKD